jgi:phosphomethylpyrimidine synthase
MCGVEFCSMRIDQDARDVADGGMDAIQNRTDLDASQAADVNLPPAATHDTSSVPDLPDFVDSDGVHPEEPADD